MLCLCGDDNDDDDGISGIFGVDNNDAKGGSFGCGNDNDDEGCLSLVTRNPVFGVCDHIRLRPACSVTEAS